MFSWHLSKRLVVFLGLLFWVFIVGCVPVVDVDYLATASPAATVASPEPEVATAVPSPTNFTRINLPNNLQPRGISDQWYVALEMAGGALYLIDIASGERTTISENGGWGNAVVTPTTVVWIGDEGHVWQYNIVTGEIQQLTQVSAERYNLVGNDRWLVWQDKRNETGDENTYAADIYAFDLMAGVEIPIAVADGAQQQPALSGDMIVWADNRNSPVRGEPLEGCGNCPDNPFDIYSFNLRTGETAVLVADGKHNAQPTISGNQVAWITFGEGIKVLDLTTGVVETAVPVAGYEGYHLANPRLEGNQLSYVIRQACDVIVMDETGQEVPAELGAFLLDLGAQETIQLTSYKEPFVLHRGTNVLIAEGCMSGFDTVYLLQDVHPASAVSPVQGPAVVSYDPNVPVTHWEYLGPEAADEFPPQSENVRVLNELHYEIRLVETAVGFDLIWGDFLCSTQPVLFIQPGNRLEFWPGSIVGDYCEAMETVHVISVSLDQPVPLAEWQFIFHAPPGES